MMYFVTIVLDGMPYIERHVPVFQKLPFQWKWLVSEGAALNARCTSWAKRQPSRLSQDGTSEYLINIAKKHRAHVFLKQRSLWNGKVEMVNAHLNEVIRAGVLMQIDADETWTTEQLVTIERTFAKNPSLMGMCFFCEYYVGPDIVTLGNDCYGNNPGEWLRAWRAGAASRFFRHEPPIFNGNRGWIMSREETRALGLVFKHYAYATEKQVAYKEQFYGYAGAVDQWKKLQANTHWPVRLKDFLPWVDDRAQAVRINHAHP